MKLFYCPSCEDMKKMTRTIRICQCKRSAGMYVDSSNAMIRGLAIPIGIDNFSLIDGLDSTENRTGDEVTAFIIGQGSCRVDDTEIMRTQRAVKINKTQELLKEKREHEASEKLKFMISLYEKMRVISNDDEKSND